MTSNFSSDGKRVSLLGYGAMRMPESSPGVIDQEHLNRQIKYLLDHGVTYYDTSPAYCRGASEGCLGEAFSKSGYGRESYVIATKLSNFNKKQYPLAEAKKMFAASLKALRTDYIDNYLLHSIGNGGFENFRKRFVENGAIDWCCELREQRKIRNLGFSYHGDPKTFDWCLENHSKYKWDFAMIQMNYVDWQHAKSLYGSKYDAKDLYDKLVALKIPVAIMEPVLGGRLARYNWTISNELIPLDPGSTQAKWAFRFCGSKAGVLTVLSGMGEDAHIEENCATFSPLTTCSKEEFAALERAAEAFVNCNTIPCNKCNYCMPCPYGLDIPAILTYRNQFLSKDEGRSAKELLREYEKAVPEKFRRADHCTGCGRCSTHCPQQIDIAKEIALIDEKIDQLRNEVIK